jgi:cell division transport system ATP-binding protein
MSASAEAHAEPAVTAAQPVVQFDGVEMRYGREPPVLEDVSFSLAPGSFHFLTGASGAGKSSLLSLIYLAARPSAGTVTLFGRESKGLSRADLPKVRRRIGVVFQDMRLLDHLSLFDNAALPLRLRGANPKTYRDDVVELLRWVGIGARVDAKPPTLSGGEKQRLALARAVVGRPDILLADEPTGNVDPAMSHRLLRLFLELNRQGVTILIASHDPDLVSEAGMPVLHLDKGKLTRHAGRDAP